VVTSLDLGVAIPTITAAVNARVMSSYKEERVAASKILKNQLKTNIRAIARNLLMPYAMRSIVPKSVPMPRVWRCWQGFPGIWL
jgi:6-phosphogluconate dehydrogenase